jgi:hypothetical protein
MTVTAAPSLSRRVEPGHPLSLRSLSRQQMAYRNHTQWAGFPFSQAHRQGIKVDPRYNQTAVCLERARVVAQKCLDASFDPP